MILHIDIETYSSVDLPKSGAYKYFESVDFEILMVAYAFDDEEVEIIDLAKGEKLPQSFVDALKNPQIEKWAHNANFERNAFKAIGYDVPINEWRCSAILAGYAGYPMSLKGASEALGLGDKSKKDSGTSLIRYFSIPCKPTKVNGGRERNFYFHDEDKWEDFKDYCKQDVVAEREICHRLKHIEIPSTEKELYVLDQEINDRGVKAHRGLATMAVLTDEQNTEKLMSRLKEITSLDNPNSPTQIKEYLSSTLGEDIDTLTKDSVNELLDRVDVQGDVREVLELRQKLAKTSVKKYQAILNAIGYDDRVRGLFQFYGANRTGRWAGRLVQLQNLPRNYMADLDLAREALLSGDLEMLYDDLGDVLSQLIRTALIPSEGKTFLVSDFSAIEARVLAWLAGEDWRLDVFNTHGKIYEASASAMFGVPIESIDKGSEYRQKGKIAELALGYGGAVGALQQMGGESMGLSEQEMGDIVHKWRGANRKIVALWNRLDITAKRAVALDKTIEVDGLVFGMDRGALFITLPSGRKLYYNDARIGTNRFGGESVYYKGVVQTTNAWGSIDTYGGKLTENIVQAIARDLLAESMIKLNGCGYDIVMSVHDEVVAEMPKDGSDKALRMMELYMAEQPNWAKGLPLKADGYVTDYYKKD